MDYNEINTFEELYIWLSCPEEKGIKGWHTDRESNDMFTLDGGRSGRICIRDQKDGVCFEFLSGNETVMRDHFSYAEAYGVCLKAMSEWKVLPADQWSRGAVPDWSIFSALKMFLRIVGCISGAILVLGSAFLLFAIWISYEAETPYYVYVSLTLSFGVTLLGGAALIFLSLRKKGRRMNITEK